ncbi:MAG: 16S rRNA (uracil(1498)-N(3))-methyltransferase [Myxococcales bacterium]|jgi:RsmE family RNA methyltransferase|nr:16S rRNA (uracil(1498)-N(3))-methyltransferase [Myxococcales bacterium]
MNLILLSSDDFVCDTRATLTDRRARHVIDVHRARLGERLRVGRLGGNMGSARVCGLSQDEVAFDEIDLCEAPPEPLPIRLILALPRPKVLSRVLESVAALGIQELFLVNAARVEKSYFDSPRLSPEEVRASLLRGLEQGCDTRLPRVEIRERFRPFVEDEVPTFFADARRLMAHPGVRDRLADLLCDSLPPTTPIVVALGPEGGFVPFELELLQVQGFRPFHLGERILRVETSVAFVIGQLTMTI